MRKSGILLHPTSLPGDAGIGDLGAWAYRFADFLADSGQRLWQILPLGPTGFGHSPYQAYSSMAGNPLLVSLEALADQGLLSRNDLPERDRFPASMVDFDAVIPFKKKLLKKAAGTFLERRPEPLYQEFLRFCGEHHSWLDSFARFEVLRDANGEAPWVDWDPAIKAEERETAGRKFIQFAFFRQWTSLKHYCNERGIGIVGDLPIFVAHDSADVRGNRELFDLDATGNPRFIAGVPPDYFSETGQCWGNPLYRWDEMQRTGYRWWIERIRAALGKVDILRLDHFRGFEKYWEIPAGADTAVNGRWKEGPGDQLFHALTNALGELPFIAEDLGYITPEVLELRDHWRFPGMRVLQFAFGDESTENPHKPYNHVPNCVVYTGTHDNDTTAGWFADERTRAEGQKALEYVGASGAGDPVDSLVRLALSSVAATAILPMQDILRLGSEARMNVPSTIGNNWTWRMSADALTPALTARLREMNRIYGRPSA